MRFHHAVVVVWLSVASACLQAASPVGVEFSRALEDSKRELQGDKVWPPVKAPWRLAQVADRPLSAQAGDLTLVASRHSSNSSRVQAHSVDSPAQSRQQNRMMLLVGVFLMLTVAARRRRF